MKINIIKLPQFLYPAILLFFLSSAAIVVNLLTTRYCGNNYIPSNTLLALLLTIIIYAGLIIQFGIKHAFTCMMREFIYLFIVMALIAFATNAVQYTPFSPIDHRIVELESNLGIDIKSILLWSHQHPKINHFLIFCYNSLPYQMTVLPLIMLASSRFDRIREYYCLLIISTLLGFTCYYFYPTLAPASIIKSPYFLPEQQATGLKFLEIHQHGIPSTIRGGLIAFPSFHVIWAWYCFYLLRDWPITWLLIIPLNLLLAAACVLLGWHYLMDIGGSVIIILMTHFLYFKYHEVASMLSGSSSLSTAID